MEKGFEALSQMVYPGRIIIIGNSPAGDDIVLYAVTGRSTSSQARRFEKEKRTVFVKPSDEKAVAGGNPELLIYPSIMVGRFKWIAVSNGKQTPDIVAQFKKGVTPVAALGNALRAWDFEPDAPNHTPRISGCLCESAALSIVKRAPDGTVLRIYFEVPKAAGKGKLIATYSGVNTDPLPVFSGEPVDIELPYTSPREAASALFKALAPEKGKDDYRVATAAVFRSTDGKVKFALKNRNK
jgi:IMP cyclohydrolase